MMAPAEQMAMLFILEKLRQKIAIEIGTRYGGRLQAIAAYSEKVYSIDVLPDVKTRLSPLFPNVEFLTGDSRTILPGLIERLSTERAELSFVLVDGDHTADG